MNIYYLGPRGSFSEIIANSEFEEEIYNPVPLNSFTEITESVKDDTESIGILPIENSITTNIHETVDTIFLHNLSIIGEANLHIRMNVIGLKDMTMEGVKKVYSKGVALKQCSEYIAKKDLYEVPTKSTSEAGAKIKEMADPTCVAIGSSLLADTYGLEVIEADVGNDKNNFTRFVFISQKNGDLVGSSNNKISALFKVKHEPGSLAKILLELASHGVNLTKIESRPIPGTEWEYLFWVDLELVEAISRNNSSTDEVVHRLKSVFKSNSLEYKIIGIYPKGETYSS